MVQEIEISAIPKHERHQEFNSLTHSICELYTREIGELDLGKFKKISIGIYNFAPKNSFFDAIDVLMINYEDDLDSFFSMSPMDRQYWLLKKLHDSMLIVANKFNVDRSVVYTAYGNCMALNLQNSYFHDRILYSSQLNCTAMVLCNHLVDAFEIKCQVYDYRGIKVVDQLLTRVEPSYLVYSRYLGKVELNGNELRLYRNDENSCLTCSLIPS